jgi:hypothetical protein
MDKKKPKKTTQEMDLKERQLKENMLLKELLTTPVNKGKVLQFPYNGNMKSSRKVAK